MAVTRANLKVLEFGMVFWIWAAPRAAVLTVATCGSLTTWVAVGGWVRGGIGVSGGGLVAIRRHADDNSDHYQGDPEPAS
jgi:hypothetical protein